MSESIKINKTTLTFNKIWYMSPNGDDTNNTGSKDSPFLTFKKVCSVATSGDAVFCYEGIYNNNPNGYNGNLVVMSKDMTLSVFGETMNTVTNFGFFPAYNGSYYTYLSLNLNFYRCKLTNYDSVGGGMYQNTIFYNCIIDTIDGVYNTTSIHAYKSGNYVKFYNCVMPNIKSSSFLIQSSGDQNCKQPYPTYFYFNNCIFTHNYIGWSPSYSSNDLYINSVYIKTNMVLSNNYIVDDQYYKNQGDSTILDPDGLISSIGIYGGPYAYGTWPNTKFTVNSITPRHLYSLGKSTFSTDITAIDETTLSQLQFRIMNGTNEISPIGIDNIRSNIGNVLSNSDQIKAISSDNGNVILDIIKEPLYRTTSERTFLKIDGGYNEKYINKSNNKAIVLDNPNDGKKTPVSNCIDLWKEITSLSGNYPYNVIMIEFTRVDNMGVREVEVYNGSTKLTPIAKDYDPYVWHYNSNYGPLKMINGDTIGGDSNCYYVNQIGPVNPYIVLSTSENLTIDIVKVYNGRDAGNAAFSTKVSIYGIYTETPDEIIVKTDSRWKLLKTITGMTALEEPYIIPLS